MPVSFFWMLNGEPVTKYAGINVGLFGKKSSVLSIDSIDQHHAGNYTCKVSNMAGLSSYSAELIVRGIATYLLNVHDNQTSLLPAPLFFPFKSQN